MNTRKWVFDGMGSHWLDDGTRGHSYVDLKIESEYVAIPVHDIHISHGDFERLARASDAVTYLDAFLAGHEICSFSEDEHQHLANGSMKTYQAMSPICHINDFISGRYNLATWIVKEISRCCTLISLRSMNEPFHLGFWEYEFQFCHKYWDIWIEVTGVPRA